MFSVPVMTPTSTVKRKSTRRKFLKSAAVLAGGGPWIVRDAFSSSGELNVMMWSDHLPRTFVDGFVKETGIKLRHLPYGSNEELLNKVTAIAGRGYDLVEPTALRALQWQGLDMLQPFDLNRVQVGRYDRDMLGRSRQHWTWNDKLFHLPYFWGTEGLSWETTMWGRPYEELSYGNLWGEEVQGRVMGRPHSMMLGMGLYLDRIGKLPSNRMLDAYKDESAMHRIWSEITTFAVENKKRVKMFWNDADTQKAGFLNNGVVLGQTWDGPANALKAAGRAISYMAPQEGALAWMDGLCLLKGAKNTEQAYAFLEYTTRPEVAAQLASETGYNVVVAGADKHLTMEAKNNFVASYPDNALQNLWWWQPEPPWYAAGRSEYRDQYLAA
jgi:spermidine/putrescine transport system substrate-binding protein